MPVSLQTQWTLVASGLVAHADHVLTGEECERLMAMVDAEVDGDEYGEWMAAIGDADALTAWLAKLELPPADTHRQILEDAWLMAVVDGERAEEEAAVLAEIATKLGVESVQLEFWRDAWTQAQSTYANAATTALRWILGAGEPPSDADKGVIGDFIAALPTTHDHHEALQTEATQAQPSDGAEQCLRALSNTQRRDVLRRLISSARQSHDGEGAIARWKALASAARVSDEEIEHMAQDQQ